MSVHVLTVDVEDWYQGLELPIDSWPKYEKRVRLGVEQILEMLRDSTSQATFFILGQVALDFPTMILDIESEGHEISSHSLFHKKVYQLTKREFYDEERKCKDIIEQIIQKPIHGFRAPFFSITKSSLWAIELLQELGYIYDSSISPKQTWRYGIPEIREDIYKLSENFFEITMSSGTILGIEYLLGGAYLRILPKWVTLKELSKDKQISRNIYLHPWELDPDHPKVKLPAKNFLTHYINLSSTESKVSSILGHYRTQTIQSYLTQCIAIGKVKELQIEEFK